MEPNTLDGIVGIRNGTLICMDRSALGRILHTSPERYLKSKEYFEENCSTMLDFLRWYNLLDCRLLCKAIEKYAKGFLDEWQTNVHEFMSVSFLEIIKPILTTKHL